MRSVLDDRQRDPVFTGDPSLTVVLDDEFVIRVGHAPLMSSRMHGSEEALATLAQKASIRDLAQGDVLMRRGEAGNSLFMVNEGWFKIVTEDAKGEELIINKTAPGETIGEMALLDEAPRSATAIALTPARVLELKKDAFYEILDQRPDVALTIIRGLSSRLRFSTTYIQKAIDWSQKIAAGDYEFIENTQQGLTKTESDDDKAAQLLSAFFHKRSYICVSHQPYGYAGGDPHSPLWPGIPGDWHSPVPQQQR